MQKQYGVEKKNLVRRRSLGFICPICHGLACHGLSPLQTCAVQRILKAKGLLAETTITIPFTRTEDLARRSSALHFKRLIHAFNNQVQIFCVASNLQQ